MKQLLLIVLFLPLLTLQGQTRPDHVEPPFWWTGMKNPELQIMLHGREIGKWTPRIDAKGIRIVESHRVENPNYLFLDLYIDSSAEAGRFDIVLSRNNNLIVYNYELRERQKDSLRINPLTPSDLIYLAMPDRFANGNPGNDRVAGMRDQSLNRNEMFERHGGDLQGVLDHLDYLEELGITALWLNPVLENNEESESYHGYAATDLYRVDPRLGDNALFVQLCDELQKRGMKMIMDVVHNHWGIHHWMIRDLPAPDWIHQWDTFTRTNYRAPAMLDPHGSLSDRKIFNEGWFDEHMPDLNQDNPLLGRYLIQNNIWWIEYAGIDAFRLDTYAYSDPDFLEKMGAAIHREYPGFFLFGETWVHGVPIQVYFDGNTHVEKDFDSKVNGLTDFQVYYAIQEALNGNFGWTSGTARLYYTFAMDYLYGDPSDNVLFLDNHDLSRFYSVVGEDLAKFKMGIAFLMTARGIPSIYYGTEILMKNFADPDGKVREDFPGGWPDDKVSKFEAEGRTEEENEAFEYVKKLARWRAGSEAVCKGKMMQFVPEQNGVYVYFRYTENETVMVVMNPSDKDEVIGTKRYAERLAPFKRARNVLGSDGFALAPTLHIPARTTLVLELTK